MNEDARNRTLGARIRLIRKAHHLRLIQRELAEKVGVTRSYITQIENGTRSVSIPVLRKIADALEVTLEELLGDDSESEERRRLREEREKFQAATKAVAELGVSIHGTSTMTAGLTANPQHDIVGHDMEGIPAEERIRMIQELLDSLTPEQRAKALGKD